MIEPDYCESHPVAMGRYPVAIIVDCLACDKGTYSLGKHIGGR